MKKKKSKKKIVIIAIVVVVVLLFVIGNIRQNSMVVEVDEETETIEKRSIAASVSATGTISASDTKSIVSTLTGYEIKTVDVQVGDYVEEGDTICTFDMSNIETSLSDAQASASVTNAQSNLGITSAQRNLDDAISNRDTQVSSAQSAVDSALSAYNDAVNQLTTAQNTLSSLQTQLSNITSSYNSAKSTYESANTQYTALKQAVTDAQSAYDDAVNAGTYTDDEIATLKTALDTATANYNNYTSTYNSAKSAYDTLNSQYSSLSSQISSAQSTVSQLDATVSSLKSAYDSAVDAYNSTVSSADSTVASMQDSLTSSELSAQSASISTNSQITSYKEQLEKGIVTATTSGTVTAVNVEVGDLYTGTTIAIISDCTSYTAETEIDEYYIADISVGMEVLVKTDATQDEELEAVVTDVALTATESALSTTSTNVTYTVKIDLNEPNDRLRNGMSAKVSIILEEKEDVWTVPYDAIYERDDGTHYIEIYRTEDSEEKEELDVETGIEGTYYTEIISDEIEEGMLVVVPATDASTSIEDLMLTMGADAGI